jgi:hypothetical protein
VVSVARPGLLKHRKFLRLVHILGEPVPHVLGYLELIWNSCYESGEQHLGDALDVELAAQWPGETGTLCKALTNVGFLDEHEGHYQVHDLWDHAPEYVMKRRQRELQRIKEGRERQKAFAPRNRPLSAGWRQNEVTNGTATDLGSLNPPKSADRQSVADLGQTPSPSPINTPPSPPSSEGGDGFDRFWGEYPNPTNRPKALRRWSELSPPPDMVAAILGAIRSQKTAGAKFPTPAVWLRKQAWNDRPSGPEAIDLDAIEAEQHRRKARKQAERAAPSNGEVPHG